MAGKLTLKQRKWLKYYMESGNATGAARQAGYKSDMAGRQNLRKSTLLKEIEKLQKKAGLTDDLLLSKHMQLLQAKRTQSCQIFIRNENGKLIVNKNSDDFIEVDDNPVQLGALKLAYEINGKLNAKPLIDLSQHTHYIVFRNPQSLKENAGARRTENKEALPELPAR